MYDMTQHNHVERKPYPRLQAPIYFTPTGFRWRFWSRAPARDALGGVRVFAGGGPPQGVDFLDQAYRYFPWLVAAVLVLTYFLLMRAFRSALLPLKAVILNLLSVAASYGMLVVVFKWGVGRSVLSLYQIGQIEG